MSDKPRFPAWNEPATKGDVLIALIYGRGVSAALYRLVQTLTPQDRAAFDDAIQNFDKKWKESEIAIDVIAGVRASLTDD